MSAGRIDIDVRQPVGLASAGGDEVIVGSMPRLTGPEGPMTPALHLVDVSEEGVVAYVAYVDRNGEPLLEVETGYRLLGAIPIAVRCISARRPSAEPDPDREDAGPVA